MSDLPGLGRVNRCFFTHLNRESQGIAHGSLCLISLITLIFTYIKLQKSSAISFSALFPSSIVSLFSSITPQRPVISKTRFKSTILFWIPHKVPENTSKNEGLNSKEVAQVFSSWEENGAESQEERETRVKYTDPGGVVKKALKDKKRRQRLALSQTLWKQGLVYFLVTLVLNLASLIFLFIGQNIYLELSEF